jgi:trigger factor
MNVTQENIDELNAVIAVTLEQADLKQPVDNALRKLGKTIQMPGFRPGMVPASLVKKKYGKAVLAEELNKMAGQALTDFIREQNIRFLGEPLISEDRQQPVDLDSEQPFTFYYDLGLLPQVHVEPSELGSFNRALIKVDADTLEKNIENLRKRYGTNQSVEDVAEGDMIAGTFFEIDQEGNEQAEGFSKEAFFMFDRVVNPEAKELFRGAKPAQVIEVLPSDVFSDARQISMYMGIKEEEVAALPEKLRFRIKEISRQIPAEVNQDFFDRLFGPGKVGTEEEFRNELIEILKRDAQQESDVRLLNDIRAAILSKINFNLPEAFLKRWLMNTDKKMESPEAADEHLEKNRDGIRWEVIRMVLSEKHNLSAGEEEIYNNARSMVVGKLAEMGMPSDDEDRLKKIVFNVLENESEYNKIRSFIIEQKVLTHLRDQVSVVDQEVDYTDFWKQ